MVHRRSVLFLLALGLLAVALPAIRLRAHGIGKPQILNEPAGPYLVSAWTDPDPLRADESHVVVGVTDPDSREPIVTGVEVTVTLTSVADPSVVVHEDAGTDSVNQLLYAAEFNDRVSEGQWRVGITVSGAMGSGQAVGFEVDIAPARGFNMLWLGVGGLAVIVGGWFVASMRGEKPGRDRRGRPAKTAP